MKIIKKSITGLILGLFLSFSVLLINKVETKADTITDLTNTVWVFNNSINFLDYRTLGSDHININFNLDGSTFSSSSPNNYNRIDFNDDYYYMMYRYPEVGRGDTVYYFESTGWVNSQYKTIYIFGGSDKSNQIVINWLNQNATQQTQTQQYTITFNANGGTGTPPASVQVNAGENYFPPGNTTNLTRNQYSFSGWSTNPNASVGDYYIVVNSDTTLYAIWTRSSYTITFNANGGTGTPPSSVQVNAGNDYELPGNTTNLTKENYHFLGWNTNQNASSMLYDLVNVQQDTTVYAIWIIDKYTITFNSNNGAGTPPASVEVNSGSDYTIPGNTSNLTKPHYHFVGWNTNARATSGLATLSNVKANTTLYAIWEIDQYTINYNANGGTGTPPASTTLDYGTTYNIGGNSTNLTRSGYIFVGWNTNQNASNGLSHITVQANTTLYAIWRVDRDDQFNIYLNDNLIAQYNIDPINESVHWYIGFQGFDIELFEINLHGGELDPLYQSSSYVLSNTISNIVFTFSGQYIYTIIIDLNGTTEEDWTYEDLVENGSNYVHFWNGGDVDIYIYTRQSVNPDTDSLISTFRLLFRGVNEVMNIRFGWITIGGILAIILSIGVVFFIFKLIRGGL